MEVGYSTIQKLYPHGKNFRCPLDRRLVGLRDGLDAMKRKKYLLLLGEAGVAKSV